jgi:hypothetical protein
METSEISVGSGNFFSDRGFKELCDLERFYFGISGLTSAI